MIPTTILHPLIPTAAPTPCTLDCSYRVRMSSPSDLNSGLDLHWMQRALELNLPVRFVGVGEQMSDLLEFSPEAFVDSLLG